MWRRTAPQCSAAAPSAPPRAPSSATFHRDSSEERAGNFHIQKQTKTPPPSPTVGYFRLLRRSSRGRGRLRLGLGLLHSEKRQDGDAVNVSQSVSQRERLSVSLSLSRARSLWGSLARARGRRSFSSSACPRSLSVRDSQTRVSARAPPTCGQLVSGVINKISESESAREWKKATI